MTIDEVAIKQKNNDVKSVKSSKCFDSTYYVLKKLSWEITYKLTLVLNQLTWCTRKPGPEPDSKEESVLLAFHRDFSLEIFFSV